MYIRVKRKNSTIFLDVAPSDSFRVIKERLGKEVLGGIPPTSIELFGPAKNQLMPESSISDLEIQNDAVLYMILKKEGSDSWEEIDVKPFEAPGDEAKA